MTEVKEIQEDVRVVGIEDATINSGHVYAINFSVPSAFLDFAEESAKGSNYVRDVMDVCETVAKDVGSDFGDYNQKTGLLGISFDTAAFAKMFDEGKTKAQLALEVERSLKKHGAKAFVV